MSKAELLRAYPKLFKGTHVHHPAYRHHRVKRVTVAAPGIVAYGDGERLGAAPDDRRALPGALHVFARDPPSTTRPARPRATRRSGSARPTPSSRSSAGCTTSGSTTSRSGLRGRRGRPRGARRGAHRLRQDARRRVRGPPGPGRAASASTRRRSRRCPTRSTPTWSSATARDNVGLLTGDNTINGEAPIVVMTTEVLRNMLYAGSRTLDRARVRRDGRGALPRRPVPRRGLGGGHHPPPRVGVGDLAVGDGVQRRGVRRLAERPCAGDTDIDRRGAAAGPAVPARDGRPPDVRPVRRAGEPGHRRSERGAGQPRSWRGSPATTGSAESHAQTATTRRRARPAAADVGNGRRTCPEPASRWSSGSTRAGLLPAIVFIFSRRAAPPPSSSAWTPACG